jgi:hypothetical protein
VHLLGQVPLLLLQLAEQLAILLRHSLCLLYVKQLTLHHCKVFFCRPASCLQDLCVSSEVLNLLLQLDNPIPCSSSSSSTSLLLQLLLLLLSLPCNPLPLPCGLHAEERLEVAAGRGGADTTHAQLLAGAKLPTGSHVLTRQGCICSEAKSSDLLTGGSASSGLGIAAATPSPGSCCWGSAPAAASPVSCSSTPWWRSLAARSLPTCVAGGGCTSSTACGSRGGPLLLLLLLHGAWLLMTWHCHAVMPICLLPLLLILLQCCIPVRKGQLPLHVL